MSHQTLILNFPDKFNHILIEAIEYRLQSMSELLAQENVPDEKLAAMDYGNDVWILEGILTEIKRQLSELK